MSAPIQKKEIPEKLQTYPHTDMYRCIDTIGTPHPFCITPKHVAEASDNHSGRLDASAIGEVERNGNPSCGVRGCNLMYDQHEQAILVEVKDPRPLSKQTELRDYLVSIKSRAMADRFAGFAFLDRSGK
mgnify:CR=1 FL=1|tara:strand:- start:903 stop:1289 length:387 start_codon:yes stop_codon:yes gene_type:complete